MNNAAHKSAIEKITRQIAEDLAKGHVRDLGKNAQPADALTEFHIGTLADRLRESGLHEDLVPALRAELRDAIQREMDLIQRLRSPSKAKNPRRRKRGNLVTFTLTKRETKIWDGRDDRDRDELRRSVILPAVNAEQKKGRTGRAVLSGRRVD